MFRYILSIIKVELQKDYNHTKNVEKNGYRGESVIRNEAKDSSTHFGQKKYATSEFSTFPSRKFS